MKNIKIYVMAHKKFDPPKDEIYIPLQVGAALHEPLGYLRDDTGDNISVKNPNYNELSGLYWMWKNGPECDITGLCHYRRYFLDNEGKLMSAGDYEQLLEKYDAVVTEALINTDEKSVYEKYGEKHRKSELDLTREAIKVCYPECVSVYDEVINGDRMYFANMMVTTQKMMDEYAQWLFNILSYVEEHIDMTGYDDYDRRVFGFIAERLVMVWVLYKKLKVYEAKVGLMGEKSETIEVLSGAKKIFSEVGYKETLKYLEEVRCKRPDLFFKDSDIKGELAGIYTVAEIMAAEEKVGKRNFSEEQEGCENLLKLYGELKEQVAQYQSDGKLFSYIQDKNLSIEAIIITIQKVWSTSEERIRIYNYLANSYLEVQNIGVARIYVELALFEGK